MVVIIEGLIFELQSIGGISRIFHEILPRMCELEPQLEIILVTQEKLMQPLPTHQKIYHKKVLSIDKILRPKKFWNRYKDDIRSAMESLLRVEGEKKIFHTTYYTYPSRWKGVIVSSVYDMIHEIYKEKYFPYPHEDKLRARKKNCLQNSDAIISISKTTGEDVSDYYNMDVNKIHVVPLAHNPIFHPLSQQEISDIPLITPRPFLLYVGNRKKHKNFKVLLNAYQIWEKRKDIDLVVVGPNWDKGEISNLDGDGLMNRVHIISHIDDEGLCKLYNQALAFIFPSQYEGFGLPILEAMACGCPIVASRIPSTLEVAGNCPIYFDAQSVDGLIDAIEAALIKGRGSEGVKSGIQASLEYSWDKTAKMTLNVYSSL
jgi:glycosyltransferase involved in cell wall biosynthesis